MTTLQTATLVGAQSEATREAQEARPPLVSRPPSARELIPGAREVNTLTHRLPGSMGGPAFGSADIPAGHSSMDAATIAERQKEGGGAESERRRHI